MNGSDYSDDLEVYRTREEAIANKNEDTAFCCSPYVPAAKVGEERERCAKIAESTVPASPSAQWTAAKHAIAARIREGKP